MDSFLYQATVYLATAVLAVPIADPHNKKIRADLSFKPIPSPIFPADYVPAKSTYREVSKGHFVLEPIEGFG